MELSLATFEPARPSPPRGNRRALGALAGVVLVALVGGRWAATELPALEPPLRTALVHGGLLAAGWLIATGARPDWARRAAPSAAATVLAVVASALWTWGALAYVLVPLALVWSARGDADARAAGLRWPERPAWLLAGLAGGVFLGAHLLVTAARTLAYPVSSLDPERVVLALAYDAGVNVVSAEWCFRGGVFASSWRRRHFWAAAALCAGLALLRHLLDPALARSPEVVAGAAFYLSLLGLGSAALRAASGSLVPGYLAGIAFFTAYRALHVGP
jgi:hypothetical protein